MTETNGKEHRLTPVDQVRHSFEAMAPQFKAALPPHIDVDRFVRNVMTAVQRRPELLDCVRNTLYGAAMQAAQDGLLPDGREAVILSYNVNAGSREKPKWEKHAQYQPMVEGLLKKVRNSGELANVSVQIVKAEDEFTYQLGDNESIIHVPALRNRGETVGAYSIATLKNGERSREFMDIDQIEAIRQRSKTKDSGPWVTDFDEMARKTVFRRHYKRLPKSTDIDETLSRDDETFVDDSEPKAVTAVPPQAPVRQRPRALQAALDAPSVEPKKDEAEAPAEEPPSDII